MTAEQLNIKIKLDISEIKNGAKKVKQELAGMTDKVKQSLPKIGTESAKAAKSLDKISDASKDVKKNIGDIGQEAKESLSAISTESEKALGKLNSLSKSNKFSIGFGTSLNADGTAESIDDADGSLSKLQGTMKSIATMDFFGLIRQYKKEIKGIFSGFVLPVEEFKQMNQMLKSVSERAKQIKKNIRSAFEGGTMGVDEATKQFGDTLKKLADKQLENVRKKQKQVFKELVSSLKAATIEAGKLVIKLGLAAAAIGAVAAAIAGAKIANDTKQYREEQSKLTTAFQAAGASAEQASQTYNNLFRFLGDSGKAVEAANHLAKLTTNTQALAEWTTIAQGVYATFGDSLPIEGLTEAANESIRVGKVTGTLADALNWAGVSEDAFNAQLERTTSLEEREVLLRSTLNGLYQNAAQIYEINNRRIIEQNEAQARLNATMAAIGQQTQVVVTSWINLKNVVLTALAPAIVYLSAVFSVLIDKIAAAIQWLGALFGISFKVGKIGGIVSGATGGVSGGISDAAGAAEDLTDNLDKATGAAQKLKRTTMGFDELNIVNDPNSSGGGGGASAGAGGTGGGGIGDITGIETGKGVFSQLGEQIEDVKAKVEAFFDKWKTQIAIIGAALATLGIATLLEHLGKALGLGNKFLTAMKTIKNLATTAIVITLQYTLVNEFLDKYINGAGFKEYLKAALVTALGTGILYSMWGPAGLVIGLGVTAVASIKSVIDNGGITNVESAVVALTGLASAIGAVAAAWKVFNIGSMIAKIGSLKGAVTAVVAALSSGPILLIVGIIAGVVSVVVFLKKNWDEVSSAVKNFFQINIVPKLEAIKNALLEAIPPSVMEALKKIGAAIADVVKKIVEWFKSVDWIKAIGKVFEVIGGIIVGVVGGAIAGALSSLVTMLQGVVEFVSGIVEIVSSVIDAIVKLCQGDLKGAWEACKNIADGIVRAFKGMYDATIGVVVEFVKGVIGWFISLWDELVGHSIVPDMIEAIIEWFLSLPKKIFGSLDEFVKGVIKKFKDMWENIKSWFTVNIAPKFTKEYWNKKFDTIRQSANDKLTAAKTAIQNIWNNVKSWFTSNIAPKFTKEYWINKFDTIKSGASQKLEEAKTTIQNIWKNITSWFTSNIAPKFTISYWTNKFNSIKDGAKAAFNGVISVVESAVNGIINRLNKLSWSIPDWVPGVGGKRFGFNLSPISIPRLATGGIATSSTLANIGERGAEAVLPLTGTQGMAWMDKLADKIAERTNGNTPSKIILNVDGRELGWATIDNINKITKQTGGLQLAL